MRYLSFLVLFALLPLSTSLAQGPLAPPAAPAPSMKTLDQVEPRIPIGQADVPLTLTNSGSYLLTSNLIVPGATAITVDADDVTIDLAGFTIDAGFSGIEFTPGRSHARIQNGTIRDAGDFGIKGSSADNIELRDLRILNCFNPVNLGDGARLIDCVIDTSGEGGVSLDRNAIVRNCAFYRCAPGDSAFFARDGSEIRDCTFIDNSEGAISVTDNCVVEGNFCRSNAFYQIGVFGAGSRVINNQLVDGSGKGIRITGTANEVSGNIVRGNADNYDIAQSNKLNLVLCELPESIDWPASVKLAGTLTGMSGADGITINAGNVTIDLAGHALESVGTNTLNGILLTGNHTNVAVRNGGIQGWGASGFSAASSASQAVVLENVTASNNREYGFNSPAQNTVFRRCIAHGNQFNGFLANGVNARVVDSSASYNGFEGIWCGINAEIVDSRAEYNGRRGIRAGPGSKVASCVASYNGDNGIELDNGCLVRDCMVRNNGAHGIRCDTGCWVEENLCTGNGTNAAGLLAGIYLKDPRSYARNNMVQGNPIGIYANDNDCLVVANTAAQNGTNYLFSGQASLGDYGEILVEPGANFTNSNPWANFEQD